VFIFFYDFRTIFFCSLKILFFGFQKQCCLLIASTKLHKFLFTKLFNYVVLGYL